MAQWNIIKSKDLEEYHLRFDSDFYRKDYLDVIMCIKKKGFLPLKNFLIKEVYIGSTPNEDDRIPLNDGTDVLFIKTNPVRKGFINYEVSDKLPLKEHNKRKLTQLHKYDVVVTAVGATEEIVGRAGLYYLENKANINQSIAVFHLKDKSIAGFISTFINTIYGRKQVWRYAGQTGQVTLNCRDFERIIIPKLDYDFMRKIHNSIISYEEKQTQSKQLYKEAENLLLEELGLVNYKPKQTLTFETTKTKINDSLRFDSEYYQPKYDEIIKRIEGHKNGFDVVKKVFDWKKGYEVGSEAYLDEGKEYLRVSDFSINEISNSNKKISEKLFNQLKKSFQPKQGEILFTKDGTIGLSYFLRKDLDGIMSSAFLRLNVKDKYTEYNKEVLTLILNSVLCKMQIEQLSGGAIIAHLKPSDFEKIKLPLIKETIQTKIAEKIKESFQLRKESKELLEKAKKMVEDEIEKEAKKDE